MDDALRILNEHGRWHAREVEYYAGSWDKVLQKLPQFTTEPFRSSPDCPSNPYLQSVVRQPIGKLERTIPVGVVSHTYNLVQHQEVAEKCLEGIIALGVAKDELECELGITELGEWANLRIYFPDRFTFIPPDEEPIRLRLEFMNSVNGSSRLTVLMSWLRVICFNGLVIKESKTEIWDRHNNKLNLDKIPAVVAAAMQHVETNKRKLLGWDEIRPTHKAFIPWINGHLSTKWGKKAAARVYHICKTAHDIEFVDPFESGDATEKAVRLTERVPGARERASTAFEVSQALSWVATKKNNTEDRTQMQAEIDFLIETLITMEPA